MLPAEFALSARVERVFLERCRRLSKPAQTLMLLAAADDSVRFSVLLKAGEQLAVSAENFLEVESAGLLVTNGDSVRVAASLGAVGGLPRGHRLGATNCAPSAG
jgi:hypothetical protein